MVKYCFKTWQKVVIFIPLYCTRENFLTLIHFSSDNLIYFLFFSGLHKLKKFMHVLASKSFHYVLGLSVTLLFLDAVGCVNKLMRLIFRECIMLWGSVYWFLYIYQHNNQINNSLPHLYQLSLFNLQYSYTTCFGSHGAIIRQYNM